MRQRVDIAIDRLVLDGTFGARPEALAAAAERELARLIAAGGGAPAASDGLHVARLEPIAVRGARGQAGDAAGIALARQLHRLLWR